MILEVVFHLVQFHEMTFYSFFRMFLFTSAFSMLVSLFTSGNRKLFHTLNLTFLILLSAYSFVELIFKNYMGDFYSFNTVSDGAMRIAQYAVIFLSNADRSYYLCFLPVIVYFISMKNSSFFDDGKPLLNIFVMAATVLMLAMNFNVDSGAMPLSYIYSKYTNKTLIIDRLGITHYLFRDLATLIHTSEEEIVIEDVEEDDIEEAEEEDFGRHIDDTLWQNLSEEETNASVQKIDEYLMSRQITDTNEYTGKYEGYNFVYFMVEALDYLAIDKDLTPTLYMMYEEGNTFYNHYTPLYSCATGESEFVSYTSIFPYSNYCTPNYVCNNRFYEALPYLFRDLATLIHTSEEEIVIEDVEEDDIEEAEEEDFGRHI
ncbi:MAG: hypothetical protein IKX97_00030, partial [Erysipelotrichaceae bacterium]|nr:hypothetical protein [Erysipelotrichaceae bacterium]